MKKVRYSITEAFKALKFIDEDIEEVKEDEVEENEVTQEEPIESETKASLTLKEIKDGDTFKFLEDLKYSPANKEFIDWLNNESIEDSSRENAIEVAKTQFNLIYNDDTEFFYIPAELPVKFETENPHGQIRFESNMVLPFNFDEADEDMMDTEIEFCEFKLDDEEEIEADETENETSVVEPQEQVKETQTITESQLFNMNNPEDVSKAEDFMIESDATENIEQIVDLEATDKDSLKKSYVGNIIIDCNVCHNKYYKNETDIVPDETNPDSEIVNIDEECPNCHSRDGYMVIGKVAPIETEESNETEEEAPVEEPVEEEPTEEENSTEETPVEEEPVEEDETKEESLSKKTQVNYNLNTINESSFNSLITKYLRSNYSNINYFELTSGDIDSNSNTIMLEGIINFKSGKKSKTQFVFESKSINKKGIVELVGLNETFSKSKNAFKLICSIVNEDLQCHKLYYDYKVEQMNESFQVKGITKIAKKEVK